MMWQKRRREERGEIKTAVLPDGEVIRLQRKVARLERALERALDVARSERIDHTSTIHFDDLGRDRPGGFAAAWNRFESPGDVTEDFFTAGQPDMRARSWLLTAS